MYLKGQKHPVQCKLYIHDQKHHAQCTLYNVQTRPDTTCTMYIQGQIQLVQCTYKARNNMYIQGQKQPVQCTYKAKNNLYNVRTRQKHTVIQCTIYTRGLNNQYNIHCTVYVNGQQHPVQYTLYSIHKRRETSCTYNVRAGLETAV